MFLQSGVEGEILTRQIVQFDQFELDIDRFELRRGTHRLKIERIPMELLILLAGRFRMALVLGGLCATTLAGVLAYVLSEVG